MIALFVLIYGSLLAGMIYFNFEIQKMNEGALPPQNVPVIQAKSDIYERRDGQWVKKVYIEGERKNIKQALRMPTPSDVNANACKHEWGPHKGPIPAVACTPPVYYYQCNLCNKQTTSRVKIPTISTPQEDNVCKHEYASDSSLGVEYKRYQACNKCGKQRKK